MAETPGWPATLVAGPVVVRAPRLRDARAWSEVRMRNESWLAPWEPTAQGTWSQRNSVLSWPPMLAALRRGGRSGRSMPFMIAYGGRFVGQINVSNVSRSALRSCTIGYWVDVAVAGRGIAPTALALVIDHCFGPGKLHRVEVDIRPDNAASLRVAEKLGLRREGYYERYLDIDGDWRDHVAFAVTEEETRDGSMLSRLSGLPVPPA